MVRLREFRTDVLCRQTRGSLRMSHLRVCRIPSAIRNMPHSRAFGLRHCPIRFCRIGTRRASEMMRRYAKTYAHRTNGAHTETP